MKNEITEDYFSSIDGIKDAETDLFFYTRLKGRMQNRTDNVSALKPAFAFALSLFLFLNIYFIKKPASENKSASIPEQEFASSFNLGADYNY